MLKYAYDLAVQDKESLALSEQIIGLILDSGVTYKKALLALEATLAELEEKTRPVRAEIPETTVS